MSGRFCSVGWMPEVTINRRMRWMMSYVDTISSLTVTATASDKPGGAEAGAATAGTAGAGGVWAGGVWALAAAALSKARTHHAGAPARAMPVILPSQFIVI